MEYIMIGKYKIITLCGSTRFKDEFLKVQKQLTLEGNIVISVGFFEHADGEFENVITPEIKVMFDDMHKRKTDMSDEIYVINKNGYVRSYISLITGRLFPSRKNLLISILIE